jgi:phosphatidylserine/phosphatidylglycerophosphate/cardiolipin synthase-like enzyme
MRNFFRKSVPYSLLSSSLYDQDSFYDRFIKDLSRATELVIIESPFITRRRARQLLPMLHKLAKRNVQIYINTRDPDEHDGDYAEQAADIISDLQHIGVTVLFTARHHRKLAVIDHEVMWEGSLNILSYNDSCEVMRRIESPELCQQMIQFTGLNRWLMLQ